MELISNQRAAKYYEGHNVVKLKARAETETEL